MIIKSFIWDHFNVPHIAEHHVSPEEAEEACFNNPLILKSRQDRFYVLGRTDQGRYLTVIMELKPKSKVYVITARSMTDSERHRFQRR